MYIVTRTQIFDNNIFLTSCNSQYIFYSLDTYTNFQYCNTTPSQLNNINNIKACLLLRQGQFQERERKVKWKISWNDNWSSFKRDKETCNCLGMTIGSWTPSH